ncbi:MAG: hypothetical protein CBC12_03575, partial [Candidatus Puniceispirillum sp. TMED52]
TGEKWRRGRIRIKELLQQGVSAIDSEVIVKGWIRTSRSAEKGAIMFVELTDGSTVKGLQLVATMATTIGSQELANCGGVGASLSAVGKVVKCDGGKTPIEVQVYKVSAVTDVAWYDVQRRERREEKGLKKQMSREERKERSKERREK